MVRRDDGGPDAARDPRLQPEGLAINPPYEPDPRYVYPGGGPRVGRPGRPLRGDMGGGFAGRPRSRSRGSKEPLSRDAVVNAMNLCTVKKHLHQPPEFEIATVVD